LSSIKTHENLHQLIAAHMPPVDPAAPIIDFDKSRGSRIFDKGRGRHIIDFACHYSSLPLGYSHPGFREEAFEKELLKVSRIKIANLDYVSDEWYEFFEVFHRVLGAEGFEKFFFIDGGALAVENTLKAAFDWKVRRNMRQGKGERGYHVIHFRQAFHGRSGYTLTMTNTTDPNKTKYYAKFDWPRVLNPKMRFPLEGKNLEDTLEDERAARNEIDHLIRERKDDIAAIIIEPVQGEGGDNHFRPEFLRYLREVADQNDILLIFDEVQTGCGMCGEAWAWQALGVEPDLFAFAKKAQVGGFMAGPRLLEEEHNVFNVPSRISSTWGASLPDMVRAKKILEIVEQENLFENARKQGKKMVEMLKGIEERTEVITNVRGLGLFVACDLLHPGVRSNVVDKLMENGVMGLVCGETSLRFRPPLNVADDEIDEAMEILERTLKAVDIPRERTL